MKVDIKLSFYVNDQSMTIIYYIKQKYVYCIFIIHFSSTKEIYLFYSCDKKKCKACDSSKESKSNSLTISAAEVSSTTNCASVLPLIPDDEATVCCVPLSSKQSMICHFLPVYVALFYI